MNHEFIKTPIPAGKIAVTETCITCGQVRKRFKSGTILLKQLDGTWDARRPGPCGRELRRAMLAAEINRRVVFYEEKQSKSITCKKLSVSSRETMMVTDRSEMK